jgi:hypothetical protein
MMPSHKQHDSSSCSTSFQETQQLEDCCQHSPWHQPAHFGQRSRKGSKHVQASPEMKQPMGLSSSSTFKVMLVIAMILASSRGVFGLAPAYYCDTVAAGITCPTGTSALCTAGNPCNVSNVSPTLF